MDNAARFRVRIEQGQLASVTDLALLSGANAIAIESPGGGWEVAQFEAATLVAPQTYELSRLLRGQAGTEHAMSDVKPAGVRVVLLDRAVRPVPLAADEIGLAYSWRYGPASRDIGDATYATTTHMFSGVGHRPLSPVHIRGVRSAGDLAISWIRRTRAGGDGWSTLEVPLAEDSERYEVDILDGATVKRTLASGTPTVLYSAADQAIDFGSPQASVRVRVCQLSATYGRGSSREATV